MTLLFLRIFNHFWRWYFIEHPAVILRGWFNFLVFGFNFFSIFFLLRTLFAPFHLYRESYGRGFDLQVWLVAAFSNFVFRVLGALVRALIIIVGLAFEVIALLGGLLVLISWFVLPVAALVSVVLGLNLLLNLPAPRF